MPAESPRDEIEAGLAPGTLPGLMRSAASSLAAAQVVLDEAYGRALDRFAVDAVASGLLAADPPLAAAIAAMAPPHAELTRHEIAMTLALSASRETRVGADLALMARPVHTFFERRFGATAHAEHAVTMTIEAIPVRSAGDRVDHTSGAGEE